MKNFLNLGKAITNAEQKKIVGGEYPYGCGQGSFTCNNGSGASSQGCVTWSEITNYANSFCSGMGGVQGMWCFGCD